jgi:hypothetical protein
MPGCPGKGGLDRAGLLPIGSILQALCCASSVLCPLPRVPGRGRGGVAAAGPPGAAAVATGAALAGAAAGALCRRGGRLCADGCVWGGCFSVGLGSRLDGWLAGCSLCCFSCLLLAKPPLIGSACVALSYLLLNIPFIRACHQHAHTLILLVTHQLSDPPSIPPPHPHPYTTTPPIHTPNHCTLPLHTRSHRVLCV